jgi:hypothetical protein
MVVPLKLARFRQGERFREADLRGALKNTDPVGADHNRSNGKAEVDGVNTPASPETVPSVATADIGSATDEQLSEAADVLRGLAVAAGRAGQ